MLIYLGKNQQMTKGENMVSAPQKSAREDLIHYIAQETRVHPDEARKTLKIVLAGILQLLKEGKLLRLVNFGAFSVREVPEAKGRNPRTGEVLQIAAHKRVVFKVGKELREAVNPVLSQKNKSQKKGKTSR